MRQHWQTALALAHKAMAHETVECNGNDAATVSQLVRRWRQGLASVQHDLFAERGGKDFVALQKRREDVSFDCASQRREEQRFADLRHTAANDDQLRRDNRDHFAIAQPSTPQAFCKISIAS